MRPELGKQPVILRKLQALWLECRQGCKADEEQRKTDRAGEVLGSGPDGPFVIPHIWDFIL